MQAKKQFLNDKFIQFQVEIDMLKRTNQKLVDDYENQLNSMNLNFIKLLDFLHNSGDIQTDNLEQTLANSIRTLKTLEKKLKRILRSNKITEISFPENKAIMEFSKIIDTVTDKQQEPGTIVETLKTGYINKTQNKIIRKAELITVAQR